MRRRFSVVLAAVILLSGASASAQEAPQDHLQPFLPDLAKRVALDPTTYVPATMLYTSMRLDWVSSQPLFQNGFVEDNSRFTRNGLVHDAPVSYAEGNRRIARDALAVLPISLANNATSHSIERFLIGRHPNHRKLVRTLGWIERVSFASYWSYRLSERHFRQWRANEQRARQLGYN